MGFLFSISTFQTNAQSIEVGTFSGMTNYMGDLQVNNIEADAARMVYGVFARFNTSEYFAFKANLYQGKIHSADRYSIMALDIDRDLDFTTDITEASIYAELAIITFGTKRTVATSYIFGGVSGFYFNPRTTYKGRWIDLQPLGTEGQGLAEHPHKQKYDRYSYAIPFGMGFKFNITRRFCFGLELGLRKTFTDYLDDVSTTYPDYLTFSSQNATGAALSYRAPDYLNGTDVAFPSGESRGNPENNDYFVFGGITLSTYLYKKR